MTSLVSLWLVTPAWRRHAVTRVCLAQRAHLRGALAERGIDCRTLVVADDNNLDVAREWGCETLERPNMPLGRKWNDGIEHAVREGADFVAVVGSDDWVHPSVFERLPLDTSGPPPFDGLSVTWSGAPEAVTGREIALVDVERGVLQACRVRGRYGVIPWVMPRALLEPSGFRPVADRAMKGLDGSLVAGLNVQPAWVFVDPYPFARVDFKTSVNLNSYETIAGGIGYGPELDAWETLAGWYPREVVELAMGLSEVVC